MPFYCEDCIKDDSNNDLENLRKEKDLKKESLEKKTHEFRIKYEINYIFSTESAEYNTNNTLEEYAKISYNEAHEKLKKCFCRSYIIELYCDGKVIMQAIKNTY